jgi:hypothetical protein
MTYFNISQIKSATLQILICGLFLTPLNGEANDAIRTLPLNGLVFASILEAVEAIRDHCLEESTREDAEHMGAVLQADTGEFIVTHGQAEPGQSQVTFAILRPATSIVVALWHTHGAPGRRTERFSIQDGDTVRETGLPFYLIAPSGDIKMLAVRGKGDSKSELKKAHDHRLKAIRTHSDLALYRMEKSTAKMPTS